jgi:hypothetical protein
LPLAYTCAVFSSILRNTFRYHFGRIPDEVITD